MFEKNLWVELKDFAERKVRKHLVFIFKPLNPFYSAKLNKPDAYCVDN